MNTGHVQPGHVKPVGDETLKGTARSLLMSVNEASIAARNGWLFFLALLAYLFIAAASVSHKDLLLNAPVVLPFLGIALRLDSFFLFGPLVLLFVHFGLLVQHVLLSRKIIELDDILVEDESWRGKRRHPLRLELHSYFYTQALAGSNRSAVFAMFLHGMVWLSLVLLPVFLILYFQVTFLPYHNEGITWAHRIFFMVEIIILLGVGIFLRKPNANFWQALARTSTQNATNFYVTLIAVLFGLFFSVCVATFPDEWIDRQLSKFDGFTKTVIQKVTNKKDGVVESKIFSPTAYFFSNTGHTASGFKNMFHRNLIVVDEDLVTTQDSASEDVTISLRGRNLRYADLSRSDLQGADFTNTLLGNAKLVGAVLKKAKFGCTELQEEDLANATVEGFQKRGCAQLGEADFSSADLRFADFRSTYSRGTKFNNALLEGARFDWAILSQSSFESAKGGQASFVNAVMPESNFFGAQMQGADFSGAIALGSNFGNANLQGTIFSLAQLQGVSFETAQLNVADLTLADLFGTNFTDAEIGGADFSSSEIWGPLPPTIDATAPVYFANMNVEPPSDVAIKALKKTLTNKISKDLRDKMNELLSKKSIDAWKESKDFKTWSGFKTQFEQADQTVFQKAYTDFVINVACQNARVSMETTAGIIVRVAKPNFSGNIESFLKQMQSAECGVFNLIKPSLQEKLLFEVHRRRRDGF